MSEAAIATIGTVKERGVVGIEKPPLSEKGLSPRFKCDALV